MCSHKPREQGHDRCDGATSSHAPWNPAQRFEAAIAPLAIVGAVVLLGSVAVVLREEPRVSLEIEPGS